MILVCSLLFGVLFIVLPCVMLVCVYIMTCSYLSPLISYPYPLFCTLCGEGDSYCFNILSRGSSVHQVSWSFRYCSVVMGIVLMCLLFLVMMHPVFVTLIV